MTLVQNQNWFELEGNKFTLPDLVNSKNHFTEGSIAHYVMDFVHKWKKGYSEFEQKSSGSTGVPKIQVIKSSQMLASAKATINTLGLAAGDTALLNINPEFIGGKMMIVRALVQSMNLIVKEATGNPLVNLDSERSVDFFSFVPYQLSKILTETPEKIKQLNGAKAIILGGAPVSNTLAAQIQQQISAPVFSTYGMTETVSHVALKRLNHGTNTTFKALNNIAFSQDKRNCLIIHAEHITGVPELLTNDVVKLYDNQHFDWFGRYDFVINSGGIKIHPEQVEEQINSLMNENNLSFQFFVFSRLHEQLGSCLCLLLEDNGIDKEELMGKLKSKLPAYHVPKEVYTTTEFQMTSSGKIDRLNTLRIAGINFN
ncbi:AMP-binding protein [Marivirga sp. S37H4]|uniref:AMP-binding protein n=1 Tax=Marivirga aurantiaca TaxID=2802615 RepID=A0A934WWP3_9BACT|nr:AMP-binding protein [Marivirga aurantiaca]MBK6264483.1 AMP-binding protein [Marivirga aurantiaca]